MQEIKNRLNLRLFDGEGGAPAAEGAEAGSGEATAKPSDAGKGRRANPLADVLRTLRRAKRLTGTPPGKGMRENRPQIRRLTAKRSSRSSSKENTRICLRNERRRSLTAGSRKPSFSKVG